MYNVVLGFLAIIELTALGILIARYPKCKLCEMRVFGLMMFLSVTIAIVCTLGLVITVFKAVF